MDGNLNIDPGGQIHRCEFASPGKDSSQRAIQERNKLLRFQITFIINLLIAVEYGRETVFLITMKRC